MTTQNKNNVQYGWIIYLNHAYACNDFYKKVTDKMWDYKEDAHGCDYD